MLDKSLLLIMIFVALFGGVAYDRHEVANGRPSPIGRFLDLAGLSDYEGRDEPVYKQQAFRDDAKSRLDRLSQLQQEIQAKRQELILNRRDVLARLTDLNVQVRDNARRFNELLRLQRKKFSLYYQELDRLNQELREASRLSDPRSRGARLAEIEEDLVSLFGQIAAQPGQNIAELASMNEDLGALATGDDQALIDSYGSVEGCFSGHMDQLQKYLTRVFERDVDAPQKDIEALEISTQQLDKEYRFFLDNSQVSMDRIWDNEEELRESLQSLVRLLISVSDEDIKNLMAAYQKVWDEQELLLENFKLNEQRLEREHERTRVLLKKIAQPPEGREVRDLNDMRKTCRETLEEREALVRTLRRSDDHLKLLLFENWERHARLLDHLARSFQLRDSSLENVRQKSQEQVEVLNRRMEERVRQTGGAIRKTRQRDPLRDPAAAISPNRVSPRQASPSWDKYERRRDQAADQGFYR